LGLQDLELVRADEIEINWKTEALPGARASAQSLSVSLAWRGILFQVMLQPQLGVDVGAGVGVLVGVGVGVGAYLACVSLVNSTCPASPIALTRIVKVWPGKSEI
jgi:hypothetical protein